MTMKALWAIVVMVSVALFCVTFLLWKHVDPTAIVSVISVLAVPVVGAAIYNKVDNTSTKVDTVQQQTNGARDQMMQLVSGVVEHLKTHNTVPIATPNTTTTVTTSTVESPHTVDVETKDAGKSG